jgi:nitrous oxidase accessory protein NosD
VALWQNVMRVSCGALVTLVAVAGCSTGGEDDPSPAMTSVPGCPDGVPVASAAQLRDALSSAEPGDVMVLEDGTYDGHFVIDRSGTSDAPIVLCGSRAAVLDGGSTGAGYALHLDGASHWRVRGLTVMGAAKGVVLDGSSDNELVGLAVEAAGEEAVHLRRNSSRNLVQGSRVDGAGTARRDIGEGIYVGSAESNWCRVTACKPDRSDHNRLVGNDVSGTAAEPIDVKEGTSGGLVSGNRLDGSGSDADSLIDIKGNGWTVEGTVGTASPGNGAAVYRILDGWGRGNVFRGNRFEVPSSGWAVEVFGAARSGGNVVDCTNVAIVSGAPADGRVVPGGCR